MSEFRKPILKKSDKNILKKTKINVKMPHVNNKPLVIDIWFKQKTRPEMKN